MANDKHQDDLLKRAEQLQQETAQASENAALKRPSGLRSYLSRSKIMARIINGIEKVLGWAGPIGRFVFWIFNRVGAWFKFAAFKRDDGDYVRSPSGRLIFSPTRLFTVSLATAASLILLHMLVSAAYYYGTYFKETVYVTGKQEIETGELYQFGGCTSLPCSTDSDNGKFYLIESSLYFPVLYYPEEEVFANIPQQDGACAVEGYGIYFRGLRWLYKSAQLYQHVVNVSCRPYTEEEIQQSVQSGQIVGDTE